MPSARTAVPALVALLALTGCGDDPPQPREGTSVEELLDDPSGAVDIDTARVGSRISLAGTVSRVLASPGAFELLAEDSGSDRPLLVLNSEDVLEPGQRVQVMGHVRVFNDDELAREHGLASASALPEHELRRVVEAEEVDTDVPEDDR